MNTFNRFSNDGIGDIAIHQSVYGEYPELVSDLREEGLLNDVLRLLTFDEDILDLYWTDEIDLISGRTKLDNELFYFKVKNKKRRKH